jgi:hypothetical protein
MRKLLQIDWFSDCEPNIITRSILIVKLFFTQSSLESFFDLVMISVSDQDQPYCQSPLTL